MMKRLLFFLFLIAGCMISVQSQEVEAFACKLLKQYPQARLLDIYKSCFQDYMGAEHLVSDTSSARSYLEYEISTTSADDLMPWYYEPCGTEGKHVRVSLRAVHEGIITTDGKLRGFKIAEANGRFHWADAEIRPADRKNGTQEVILTSAEVPNPAKVRYGWDDDPLITLYGSTGLPVAPFEAH